MGWNFSGDCSSGYTCVDVDSEEPVQACSEGSTCVLADASDFDAVVVCDFSDDCGSGYKCVDMHSEAAKSKSELALVSNVARGTSSGYTGASAHAGPGSTGAGGSGGPMTSDIYAARIAADHKKYYAHIIAFSAESSISGSS